MNPDEFDRVTRRAADRALVLFRRFCFEDAPRWVAYALALGAPLAFALEWSYLAGLLR
jgi:hypothetical protein